MAGHLIKYLNFRNAFFALSIISFIALPLLSRNAGMSGDEELHFNQSEKVYNFFKSHGNDKSALTTPGTHLKYYGQAFDNITTILIKWFNIKDVYQFRHIANSLVGWSTIFIAGLLTASLAGYRAGFITLLLFLVSARFIGHSWNNLKDIPFALGYIASIYFIFQFLKKLPQPSVRNIILLIISVAFTIGIRIGGVLLICYLVLFAGLYLASNYLSGKHLFTRRNIFHISLLITGISIIAYFMGLILWPFAFEDQLINPWLSYKAMAQFPTTLRQIFEGSVYWSDQFPWYYLLKYMIISIPTVALVGLLLFTVYSNKILGEKHWIFIFFLLFSVIFPMMFIIAGDSNVYGAWRHVIFIYPPLVVLSALGFDWVIKSITSKKFKILLISIIVILFIHPVRFMIKNHPYEYLYFNELTGGLNGAYGNYETDYYYHSIREASEWLQEYIEENNLYESNKIDVAINFPAGEWFFRHNNDKITTRFLKYYSRGNQKWDFAIVANSYIHPYQLQKNIWPPENTIHTIEADGIPICAILERKSWNDYLGFTSLQNSQLEEAKYLLVKALEEDPANESVLINLSMAYINSNDLNSAEFILEKCLKIYPDYEPAIHQAAKIQQLQGNTDEAIKTYKENLENNYKYFPSYIGLASVYFETGKDDLALKNLKKCLSINPAYKPALHSMGIYYQRQGKTELAEKYFISAKKL